MNYYLFVGVLIISIASIGCSNQQDEDADQEPLFQELSSERTQIEFSNTLSEKPTPHRNILLYEYFSNGGGVAVGDLNGNGRDDLYFTGNMTYNRLYLNQGDMTFQDVTEAAGVSGRRNTWKTGVAMADVNGDGLLDIYVCYSGDLPLERRIDELYINQGPDENGIPRFEEQAEAYGLANPHSSNQAYFFDYDRDGDLDLFLLTHNVKNIPRREQSDEAEGVEEEDPISGVRLYENTGGAYEDVTVESGIKSTSMTYGLGAGVSDINKDGWPDIYIGNDYSIRDYLYINNGDGTFTDELRSSMGHISRASMGIDAADVNNDGLTDIVVLDMLAEDNRRQKLLYVPDDRDVYKREVRAGHHHQYMRNTLQLNNGNETFSEIGQLAGISNTDWSWAPLAADYDNDGWKDLFVTNGYLYDTTNLDFLRFKTNYILKKDSSLSPNDVAYLMSQLPTTDLENYMFEGQGGLQFDDVSTEWGVDVPALSNGAAYSDLDNDGDLDLITNNINEEASILENKASELEESRYLKVRLQGSEANTHGIGAKLTLFSEGDRQFLEQVPMRGYLSSVSPILHFGLGQRDTVDSLRVQWPDGTEEVRTNVEPNQQITLDQSNASDAARQSESTSPRFEQISSPIDFEHRMESGVDDFRRQPLMVNPKSFSGPALAEADVNGDGLADVFVGGGSGQASALFLQHSSGQFTEHPQDSFEADSGSNDVDAVFFDYNGNGFPDLYVASGGYDHFTASDARLQDRLYLNDGEGNFTKAEDALPEMRSSTGAVATADINDDGLPDLFVGGYVLPGRYPESSPDYVLVQNDQGRFEDQTTEIAPDLQEMGMVSDASWSDLSGNGVEELIVVGEWMPLTIFENEEGELREQTDAFFSEEYRGLWNAVHVEDVNGDGRDDLVAGNFGLNSQLTASFEHPAELYYGDFNDDGSIDPILNIQIKDDYYPYMTLDELREQMPVMASKFSSYEEYAGAKIEDILPQGRLEEAERLEANYLKTALFINDGEEMRKAELPVEAQFAPVFSVRSGDYNGDGSKDLLLTGNINEARVRFGKYDANYGVLMEGNGEGGFDYVPQYRSGFQLEGDIRGAVRLGDVFLFATSREPLQAYRLGSSLPEEQQLSAGF